MRTMLLTHFSMFVSLFYYIIRATVILYGNTVFAMYMHLFYPNIETFADLNFSPAIFGDDLCNRSPQITISNVPWNWISMLGRGKITLRGLMDGKNVFVKKLADPEEFSNLHKKAANLLGDHKVSLDMIIDKIDKSVRQIDQKLILCPEETEVQDFLGEIRKKRDFKQLISIWTSLEANPEAAMLQMLQPPIWPVPKYYGACGSLIVVKDCGDMLTDYYDKSYNQRARISAKLLRMAMMFTFRHQKYAFYFSDFSPDNIAVDSNENVCLVDLENIYVVDKYPKDTSHYPKWNITYSASHYNCQDCFLFRPSEICSHQISDQNILSVCREILFTSSVIFKEGFLYDSPADIFWMIYDCVNVNPGETRFKIAEQLITTLEKY